MTQVCLPKPTIHKKPKTFSGRFYECRFHLLLRNFEEMFSECHARFSLSEGRHPKQSERSAWGNDIINLFLAGEDFCKGKRKLHPPNPLQRGNSEHLKPTLCNQK